MLKTIFVIALIIFLVALAYRQVYTLIKHDIPMWKEQKAQRELEKVQNKKSDTSEVVGDSDSK